MSKLHTFEQRYDAVISGARCAGAATALLLARAGARVLVVDRQTYGSDTMSTHALMRSAVIQLKRWGLGPGLAAAGTPQIRSTTFHYGGEAMHIAIKPEHGVDSLYAPRRTVIDRLLVDAARNAGADVRHGGTLSELMFTSDGRVIGAGLTDTSGSRSTVRADIVIGADGRQSAVAQLVKAKVRQQAAHASGVVFGYFENLPLEGFHWHFTSGVAAGVIPTNGGHCVFAAVPSAHFHETFRGDVMSGFLKVLEANAPELRAAVEKGALTRRLRGFAGAPGYLRQCHGAGWALVGDAGYFKDPLTAHGITDALRDAELLSRAILAHGPHNLEFYQRERDELSRPFLELTDATASFTWDLDEVKQLHARLSAVMKKEASYVAALSQNPLLAA